MPEVSISFAVLEAILSTVHRIKPDKRTAFQARIKNFQRLGMLEDLITVKGRPTEYEPHHVYLMALAIELTQLGLTPDGIIEFYARSKYGVAIAAGAAVRALRRVPERPAERGGESPKGYYMFFDPHGLSELSDGPPSPLFLSTLEDAPEQIRKLSDAVVGRFAGINVTTLIDAAFIPSKMRDAFLDALEVWAEKIRDDFIELSNGNP